MEAEVGRISKNEIEKIVTSKLASTISQQESQALVEKIWKNAVVTVDSYEQTDPRPHKNDGLSAWIVGFPTVGSGIVVSKVHLNVLRVISALTTSVGIATVAETGLVASVVSSICSAFASVTVQLNRQEIMFILEAAKSKQPQPAMNVVNAANLKLSPLDQIVGNGSTLVADLRKKAVKIEFDTPNGTITFRDFVI